jgi:hypothetical protein
MPEDQLVWESLAESSLHGLKQHSVLSYMCINIKKRKKRKKKEDNNPNPRKLT